ncbi:GntR family transcriptional regulator [Tabrizicola oligotrophica]|uniref:GntR family transcriptional regulator n=1 Tax=Tabrizicola oligotrophica TaxID=2710650 RepID=A0A6M0QRW8_9RHOB|nr:GntR family transcriptional regulator [Tabrizicola oligotrophica]NEY90225.1 GntR family transcriptional regulator [Tabrizicola oligotrophica]
MADQTDGDQTDRKRGSGARLVYDTLRDEILSLTLAPGETIDEAALADRLAMSRTPIREALVRLAADGLVSMLPNRSTIVAPIDFLNLPHFFDAMTLMYRVTTRLAATNHTPADLTTILERQAIFARAVAAGESMAMIAANRDFHLSIAEAGGNPYYSQLFARLLDEGRRILLLYYYPSFESRLPHPYIVEHEAIIAAVIARDVEECDRLARDHADQIVAQIQALIARDRRQHPAL